MHITYIRQLRCLFIENDELSEKLDHSNFYRNCEGLAETVKASHRTYP